MKKIITLLLSFVFLLSSCASKGPATLTVMTHSSFAVSEEIVKSFETANNVTVNFVQSGDAGETLDVAGNRDARIDQAGPFDTLVAIHQHDADLGDAIERRVAAGRFQIDNGQRRVKQAHRPTTNVRRDGSGGGFSVIRPASGQPDTGRPSAAPWLR